MRSSRGSASRRHSVSRAVAFLGVFLALLSIRPGVVRARRLRRALQLDDECRHHVAGVAAANAPGDDADLLRVRRPARADHAGHCRRPRRRSPVHRSAARRDRCRGIAGQPDRAAPGAARGVRTGAARGRSRRRRELHGRARRVELARAGPGDHRVDRRDVGGGLGRREHRRPLPQPGRDQRASNGSALHDRQRRRRRRLGAVRLGIGPHRPGLGAGDRRRRSDPDRPVSLALGQEPLDGHGPDVRATAA